MDYSIDAFWRKRFASVARHAPISDLSGWHTKVLPTESFVEASLSLRDSFIDLSQGTWLIAASGAVGKSTFAKEICALTGAVYLDLAESATVAGNYLVGGLVKTGLWKHWLEETTTLVIDALDEARLRVTQSSFEDFLADVAEVSNKRNVPIVLLGRVGIVEEAWTILNERFQSNPPIFDIELFHADRAKQFVLSSLNRLSKLIDPSSKRATFPHLEGSLTAHAHVYSEATQLLVEQVTLTTSADGRRFAGYAPVLEAIATVIASESNPARIGEAMRSILQGQVLEKVTSEVLSRESGKLASQLKEVQPGINTDGLYTPREQLARLASVVLGISNPPRLPALPPNAVAPYEQAVQSLLPQHPFLDSTGRRASSAVFGASILAAALKSDDEEIRKAAEHFVDGSSNPSNPFLLDFYLQGFAGTPTIPTSHVGLLYASLEAAAGVGDAVRLTAEENDQARLSVEISLIREDGPAKDFEFWADPNSALRFGRRLSGVTIEAERTDIELGIGGQLELVAPIYIHSRLLFVNCREIVVKPDSVSGSIDRSVYIEATEVACDSALRPAVIRAECSLSVAWPGSKSYPWTPFSTESTEDADPRMAECQRALRRLCISFRSHSKGRLARYRGKVEHFRMTKGALGELLRARLVSDGVLSLEGEMYYLDADQLGNIVGIGFRDLKEKNYSERSRTYLQNFLQSLSK